MELQVRSKRTYTKSFMGAGELLAILEELKPANAFISIFYTSRDGDGEARLVIGKGSVWAASLNGEPVKPEDLARVLGTADSGEVLIDEIDDTQLEVQVEYTADEYKYNPPVPLEAFIGRVREYAIALSTGIGEAAERRARGLPPTRTPEEERAAREAAGGKERATASIAAAVAVVPEERRKPSPPPPEVVEAYPGLLGLLRDLGIRVDEGVLDRISRELAKDGDRIVVDVILAVAQALAMPEESGSPAGPFFYRSIALRSIHDIEALKEFLGQLKDIALEGGFIAFERGAPPNRVEGYTALFVRNNTLCAAVDVETPEPEPVSSLIQREPTAYGVEAVKRIDEVLSSGEEVKAFIAYSPDVVIKYVDPFEECRPKRGEAKPAPAERGEEKREKRRRGFGLGIFRRR